MGLVNRRRLIRAYENYCGNRARNDQLGTWLYAVAVLELAVRGIDAARST